MNHNPRKLFKKIVMPVLLLGLLATAGCGKKQEIQLPMPNITIPTTEIIEDVLPATEAAPAQENGDSSLLSLRQAMVGTPELFAVAYFGCHETRTDTFTRMRETEPQLCADLPFLLEIPEDRVIGESGDLFCIIPMDAEATVAVSKGYWDEENQQCIYDDMLYSGSAGDPILLFCNNDGWEPDTQVYISGESGEIFWYPQKAMFFEENPQCRILTQPIAPEPMEMVGTWELGWTEVEGDIVGAEPGEYSIEIGSSASSGLLMSYTSRDFPDKDFQNALLTIDNREMYHGCGNAVWVADVDYIGPWDTTYTITLTADGILIKQNYFLLDGAPSVSYEYFCRVEG